MGKKILVALGLVAVIIILYFFYAGGLPFRGPEKPRKPGAKPQAAPEAQGKPVEKPAPVTAPSPAPAPASPTAPAPLPAPAPQAPTQPSPPQPAGPPEKLAPPPEAPTPAPKETRQPTLEPQEGHGLLAKSFRKYADAKKLMEKLKKQGQEAFIKREGKKFQVWVGPFATRKEAEATARSLKAKNKISPKMEKYVTPVPK